MHFIKSIFDVSQPDFTYTYNIIYVLIHIHPYPERVQDWKLYAVSTFHSAKITFMKYARYTYTVSYTV